MKRLLEETGKAEVVGSSTDPVEALAAVQTVEFDVLFLDIQMPGLTGFEFLARLTGVDPLIVFTTAYDQYALRAFEVNSVDYLVKPVETEQLARALRKVERMLGESAARPPVADLVAQIAAALTSKKEEYPSRISSRIGDKTEVIELRHVTHIFAEEKFTFAVARGKQYILDSTIAQLEAKLDPKRFVRIHRSTIVNLDWVQEMYSLFAGKMLVRLKDDPKTELTVARERVKELRESLGI